MEKIREEKYSPNETKPPLLNKRDNNGVKRTSTTAVTLFLRLVYSDLNQSGLSQWLRRGWRLSEDADLPFATRFHALGVEFDLSEVCNGHFTVGNTSSRKEEIGTKIDSILTNNELEPAVAESMRSRLLFAEAQIYGRHAKIALQTIGHVGLSKQICRPLTTGVKRALTWMKDRVLHAAPQIIETAHRTVLYLFLDGACTPSSSTEEWSGTSVGAVLADSSGNVLRFFGHVISPQLVASWGKPDKTQYIFEAEVLPYTLCLLVWKDLLCGCALFAFIDNEAARASWISASALP